MFKYYIINVTNRYLECGSIIKCEINNAICLDNGYSYVPIENIIRSNLIELSETKAKYLLERHIKERMLVHHSGLFEKIEQLEPNKECILSGRFLKEKCLVLFGKDENYNFVVQLKHEGQKKIPIFDIVSLINVEYYICVREYTNVKVGTIVVEEGDSIKTYPDGQCTSMDLDKLEKISRAEAVFICENTLVDRFEMYRDKLWESVENLVIGDACCLKTKMKGGSFRIIGKNKSGDSVKYSLESMDKKRTIVDVDVTDIRPVMMKMNVVMGTVPILPLRLSFTENGVVNADKYLKCVEKWDGEYLKEKNICKNGKVSVNIGKRKKKGTLKWCGTMNGECVVVVELDEDFVGGTDGRFWRENLIKCRDKRAVAVTRDKVCEYIPYKKMSIPLKDRQFEQIDVNSAVVYYVPGDGILVNMYGTVRWSGMDENDVYIYGIELDDKYKDGTDGEFDGHRLFQCQYGHGVLAPINKVAPDTRFIEMKVNDEDIKKSVMSTIARYSIPVIPQRGENYGIQGKANSSHFDSSIFALFSKSDVLDFMISEIINEREENDITKRFRDVMAWSIVYPLRDHGFVSFHHTKALRDVIKDYGGKFTEMTKPESDIEIVAALLSKLCPDNQLLSLRSFSGHKNRGMFLQLSVTLHNAVVNISSQQMLEVSMAQNDIMFDEPPTCLIMQAPRDARGINCYQNVLPSKTIEISNLCSPCIKKCHKCASKATYQCKKCIEGTLRVKDGLMCDRHKCHHDDVLKFHLSKISSKSQIQMQLKAIICIEKAHFVAYVKEDEFKSNWVFFDSMSTQNIANNYAVPKVSFEKEVSDFLNQDEREMERMVNMYGNDNLKRVVKDSYIFVYHNTTKTCY